jgi:hypothetical protein
VSDKKKIKPPAADSPKPASDAVPVVTLITDFGERDGYVGIVKGVVL